MLKHHWKKTLFLLPTIAMVVLGGGTALAQDEGGAVPPPGPRFERLAERLDLDDAQREKIAEIMEAGRSAAVETRKKLARLRNELEGEMLADKPSASRVENLIEQIGAARTDLQKHHASQRLTIREGLTPEQRDRMLLMKAHRRGGGQGWHRGAGDCGQECRGHGRRGSGRHGRGGAGVAGPGIEGSGGGRGRI